MVLSRRASSGLQVMGVSALGETHRKRCQSDGTHKNKFGTVLLLLTATKIDDLEELVPSP